MAITGFLVIWTVVRIALAIAGMMPPIGHAFVDVFEFVVPAGLFALFAVISRRSGDKGRVIAATLASLFWSGYAIFIAVTL